MLRDTILKAHVSARAHLLSLRSHPGGWAGELSSSALSTATAVIALLRVDREAHEALAVQGLEWLERTQCREGGWGDTTISKPNLSTTLLCRAAFGMSGESRWSEAVSRCEAWVCARTGAYASPGPGA